MSGAAAGAERSPSRAHSANGTRGHPPSAAPRADERIIDRARNCLDTILQLRYGLLRTQK